MTLTEQAIATIAAGCEGVTEGPWRECGHDRGGCTCGHVYGDQLVVAVAQHASLAPDDPEHQELTTHDRAVQRANAAHIARLDPATVLALCALAQEALQSRREGQQMRDKLDSCAVLLEMMAESADARGDVAEFAMMSVMAKDARALSHPKPQSVK